MANAYLLPLRGLDGAGEGGKSCPSRSIFATPCPITVAFFDDEDTTAPGGGTSEADIANAG